MSRDRSGMQFTRRRFAFWVGLGLFTLGEKLEAAWFDDLAAAAMRGTEPQPSGSTTTAAEVAEHWSAAENRSWQWFERENLVDGQWKLTGVTRPLNKRSGEYHDGEGYLDVELVPPEVRFGRPETEDLEAIDKADHTLDESEHLPSADRRARHGRPPSKWLRSLNADELRIWLKTIDVPEAGVSGMTFWTHLTRDHFFDGEKIAGLTIPEQAQLHAAAHYGY